MAKIQSKITPLRQSIRDVAKGKPLGLKAKPPKAERQAGETPILPGVTKKGAKSQANINVPGVKTL